MQQKSHRNHNPYTVHPLHHYRQTSTQFPGKQVIVSGTIHIPHRLVNHTAFSVPTFRPQQYSVVVYVTLSPPLFEG